MTITWFGQACFRLSGKSTALSAPTATPDAVAAPVTENSAISLLIDPFDKKLGLKTPRLNDQIILVSHEHSDHNAIDGAPAEAFIIRGPGEYEKSGVQIVGIPSFHDNEQGATRGRNTIYVIKMEGITMCHLGDLGQKELTPSQIETIGNVDILFVPIGGVYTIDGKEAVNVVKQIEPKIIIPMHYKVGGLTVDLESPSVFFKEVGMKPEEVDSFKIVAKNLPSEETKLIQFKI